MGGGSINSAASPHPRPLPTVRCAHGGRGADRARGSRGNYPITAPSHLHRPRHPPRGRAAHALHLAAQGAGGRHRAQSRAAGRRDGAADPHRDPHRRHAGLEAPAPAPRPAAYPAHDARAACADPGVSRRAVLVRLAPAHRARRVAFARRSASAAICCRLASHDCSRWRPASPASACRRRSPCPTTCAAIWCRSIAGGAALADLVLADAGAAPDVRMLDTAERLPWAGHSAHHAMQRDLRPDQAPQDHARLRQHPQPGGDASSRSCGASTTTTSPIALHHGSLDVAQRRKVEAAMAVGTSARGGLHLDARSRHRLGRRRSRDPGRRAQGRLAAAAAHRPRQSPHGRALEGAAGAGQSLRGAGMHRRARCDRRERAGHAEPRASARSTCWPSTFSASACGEPFRPTSFTRRSPAPRLCATRPARDFERVLDFVATGGYALSAYERFAKIAQGNDGRWRITHPMHRAALPHECRHHRRSRHAEGAAGALARLPR